MTTATISPIRLILLLAAAALILFEKQTNAGELVSIRLNDGKKMTAEVHPRTNDEHLWLRFGSGQTVVLRAVDWSRIAAATIDGQPASAATLRRVAAEQVDVEQPESPPTYAERARELLGFRRRVNAVDFDAHLANWDPDVEFDGIALRLLPLDADGQITPVPGTLYVELVAAKRQKFNDVPSARGQQPSRIGRWSVSIDANDAREHGVIVKLPFRTIHPEFDTNWATHGLVHVRFVVPGHGVFEHSFDGVRLRPYAPLRDMMERQNGQRFLPTERTGVSKRLQ